MIVRVAALTTGLHTPSSRFRVRQHIGPLAEHDILVREFRPVFDDTAHRLMRPFRPTGVRVRHFPPAYPLYIGLLALRIAARVPGVAASGRYDVTWLERGLCEGWPTLEKLLRKPLVLDVDDAVWLAEPFGAKQMQLTAQRADAVIVCNSYLAEWFVRFCPRIEFVPTPVDGNMFYPINKADGASFIVGWTGTSSNFDNLAAIRGALARFFRQAPDARLRIVADAPPPDLGLTPSSVEFVKWSEGDEAKAVQTMDVGIMPLVDNAWTRGKCAFKAIQYMACGLPVVASPVGMNAEALGCGEAGLAATTEQQWLDALVFLFEHREQRRRIGTLGRARFLERYDLPVVTRKLAQIFTSFA